MKSLFNVLNMLFFLGVSHIAFAQESSKTSEFMAADPDPAAHWYVFGLGLGVGVGGAVSWKFHQTWTGEFTQLQEGWFGKDTYAGGADKLGHFYTDFVMVRAFHDIYQSHHFSEEDSIWYGFWGTMATRTVMEVADGYTTFKFSMEDLIANMLGSLTSAALLTNKTWDDLIGFSWTYMPSQEKLDGEIEPLTIDNDYNGSIYHMDFKLDGIMNMFSGPDEHWLRDYNLGISYYTRGYDRERDIKSRVVGLTFGLNLARLMEKGFSPDSQFHKKSYFMKYFKLPFSFFGYYYDLDQQRSGFRYGMNYFY